MARIGDPVLRVEDARFLAGHGRFVGDIVEAGMLHAVVVRSPYAHARIRAIDTHAASAAPGVRAVLTAADAAADGIGDLPCRFFPPVVAGGTVFRPSYPVLARDKVRHVGDRAAVVVAETLEQAKDAAELVAVDYEPLPAAAELEQALAPGAPKVWDEATDNVSFRLESGDAAQVEQAFRAAAHVSRLKLHYPRASANPIEPRAVIGVHDRFDRRSTLYSTTQAPFRARDVLSEIVLRAPEADLRVIAPDVGGGFGMKGALYPEEALAVWAAKRLGQPVKWTAERGESLQSDMHGRDLLADAELALAADGRMLALRVRMSINLGAYLGFSAGAPAMNAATTLTGPYDLQLVRCELSAVFTHTTMIGPYRGAGRPEATFIMERLIDTASREMRIDPVRLRRRNLIAGADFPYRTAGGHTYDSGDFTQMLDRALALAQWDRFPARRRESEHRGLRRGIGLAMHCEFSGMQSERMEIRIDPNGSATVHVGTLSTGQGHETMFAQMVSDWLGVPVERVRVLQGDTDRVLFGRGTFAERSTIIGGSALRYAADEVIRKGREIAAAMLEVAPGDIAFAGGEFNVAGTDRRLTLRQVARHAYSGAGLPSHLGLGLDGSGTYAGAPSYPNGCIICELEADPETGAIAIERISAVDDAGVIVNPLMLEGQLHGSMAQGLGQAMMERIVYDAASGELLSGSFLDYAMPRASDMPPIESEVGLIPATTNPLGVKGGSEAGNIAAPPAIVNAIVDALGVMDIAMPATPERVWRALHGDKQ